MITEFFMNMFFSIVSNLLGAIEFVITPLGSFAGLLELLSYASIFVPLQILGAALMLWVSFYVLRFFMVVINWTIAKIPTID